MARNERSFSGLRSTAGAAPGCQLFAPRSLDPDVPARAAIQAGAEAYTHFLGSQVQGARQLDSGTSAACPISRDVWWHYARPARLQPRRRLTSSTRALDCSGHALPMLARRQSPMDD